MVGGLRGSFPRHKDHPGRITSFKGTDFNASFKLAMETCKVGIGAGLIQDDKAGHEMLVVYISKPLKAHQKAYSTIEKETLDLVLAVQHFLCVPFGA